MGMMRFKQTIGCKCPLTVKYPRMEVKTRLSKLAEMMTLRWPLSGSLLGTPGSPLKGALVEQLSIDHDPLLGSSEDGSASETLTEPWFLLLQSQILICPVPLHSWLIEVLVSQQWPCSLSLKRNMWGRFAFFQVTGWKYTPPLTSLGFTF